jgi:hypothetical protein
MVLGPVGEGRGGGGLQSRCAVAGGLWDKEEEEADFNPAAPPPPACGGEEEAREGENEWGSWRGYFASRVKLGFHPSWPGCTPDTEMSRSCSHDPTLIWAQ